MNVEQRIDLRPPGLRRKMGEVDRVHAQMSVTHRDHGFEDRSLKAHRSDAAVLRKQMMAYGEQRRAREQHVAELTPPGGARFAGLRAVEVKIDSWSRTPSSAREAGAR